MPNKYVALTCVIGCLFILALSGCGSDTEDLSDEPVNQLPMVRKLSIPDEFEPGETIELQITAHDPDGDTLSYTWRVSAGTLDATTGSTVKWTAPSDTRSVTITVRVNDGPDSGITRSRTVTYVTERPPEVPKLNIIPGKRAAGINLGDPFNTVIALYGKQDDPIDRTGFFAYWDDNIGISGFVDNSNNVTDLFIRRPNKSKTPGGIGIGSTLKQVENEFGPAEEIREGHKAHWYRAKGIQFDYNADSRVEKIYVFSPIGAAPAKAALVLAQKQQQQAAKEFSLYQRRHRYERQEVP